MGRSRRCNYPPMGTHFAAYFALPVLNDSFFSEIKCFRKADFTQAFENLIEENVVALKAYNIEIEIIFQKLEVEGKFNRISYRKLSYE
jgi:hypothetical protein